MSRAGGARHSLTWLAVLGMAAAGLGLFAPATTASASCVGPMLEVRSSSDSALVTPTPVPRLAPGTRVSVLGQYFANGCNDTGGGPGCGAPPPPPPVSGQRGVRLELVQGAKTWDLGTKDADATYEIRWAATIPADVAPGDATLRAGTATLPVTVAAG